jgi:hypothetical protein
MSFYASNNRIYLTNTGGQVVFDTDWKMPVITNIVTGSITLPSRGNTGQTAVNHYLANVSGSAEFVLTTASISGGTGYPWVGARFNSSGSVLTNLGWNITDTWRLAGARSVSFFTSGGALYLREEFYNQSPARQLAAFTLNYRVYIGSFV